MENEYLEIFKNVGMGTTIWSPLSSGLLTGKYNNGIPEGSRFSLPNYQWLKDRIVQDDRLEKVKALAIVAEKLDTSLSTLSVAWTLCNPNVTTTILGATKDAQLRENLQALELYPRLTTELLTEMDTIMGTRPVAETIV
jgi:aryl-alcohol dehydrogenase-like predicted oxidoreductase